MSYGTTATQDAEADVISEQTSGKFQALGGRRRYGRVAMGVVVGLTLGVGTVALMNGGGAQTVSRAAMQLYLQPSSEFRCTLSKFKLEKSIRKCEPAVEASRRKKEEYVPYFDRGSIISLLRRHLRRP